LKTVTPFFINLSASRNCVENEHFQRLISAKLLQIINMLLAVNNRVASGLMSGLNKHGDLIRQR
jgi:hypothetical protein